MGFMNTTKHIVLTSPLPPTADRQRLIALLQDHMKIVNMSPLAHNIEPIDSPSAFAAAWASFSLPADAPADAPTAAYRISEHVPYYGEVVFRTSFRDTPQGIDTISLVPLGTSIVGTYRVREEQGRWCLAEESKVTGNAVLMPFIRKNFEASHRVMHEKLIKEVEGGS